MKKMIAAATLLISILFFGCPAAPTDYSPTGKIKELKANDIFVSSTGTVYMVVSNQPKTSLAPGRLVLYRYGSNEIISYSSHQAVKIFRATYKEGTEEWNRILNKAASQKM